MVNRRCSSQSV